MLDETMAALPTDALETATLSELERRVVERLMQRLRHEIGTDLRAIWLYGSRARGQAPHPESDIDLLVIADGGERRHGKRAIELVYEVAGEHGVSPVWYSVRVRDLDWLRERRAIRSFFVAEVDRDKIVLSGSGLE
jgi:predicted nucleotidyltransferase